MSYCDIYSTVCNNGFTSSWFNVHRGVRQGCLLSCLLSILVAEILAQNIRNNDEVKCIIIGNVENKINQFADDTACTLRNEDICPIYPCRKIYNIISILIKRYLFGWVHGAIRLVIN